MFFFEYNCYCDGKLLIEMRNGVAGFFSKQELDEGKGVVWTEADLKMRAKYAANKKDPSPCHLALVTDKKTFSEADMQKLSDAGHKPGTWGEVMGPSAADVQYKLCARKILMADRVTHILPRGGVHGLGLLVGEKILERDHWCASTLPRYSPPSPSSRAPLNPRRCLHAPPSRPRMPPHPLRAHRPALGPALGTAHGTAADSPRVCVCARRYFPCHFKNDQVMAGSLVSDGCSQILKMYMIYMGMHKAVEGITFTPVHNQPNKVRCRGQISPHKGKLVYWVEISELGFDRETGYPYAKADVNIIDINYESGESFDHPSEGELLAALEPYCRGNMKKRVVVDFRGVALQMEGPPTAAHPILGKRVAAVQSVPRALVPAPPPALSRDQMYAAGGLHLSGGQRSALPPQQFMKWGGATVGGHKLTWHPWAGRDGHPTPGFRATSYPPRPICFTPFPNNPNDTNHTPGELPLSWVNMCEFMCNDLSKSLGDDFKGFDEASVSRSPAFDLALTTRVLSVTGLVEEKGSTKFYGTDRDPSSGTMVAEFDCPADAWFFVGAPNDAQMPYSILMEIALQTCGILTSWNKVRLPRTPPSSPAHPPGSPPSALAHRRATSAAPPPSSLTLAAPQAPLTMSKDHGFNLLFRNLDATAKLYAHVDLRGKTIVNTSKCTGYAMLGQMGVQKFNTVLEVDGKPFYEVDSSFGWFLPAVFEKQVGLDNGVKRECWHVANKHPVTRFALPADEGKLFAGAVAAGLAPAHLLSRRSDQVRFLDEIGLSATGGEHGKGYGHGFKTVDPRDWFFSCHFWCDPVMPGSLGIEAMHQTLELFCVHTGLGAGIANATFTHDLGKTTWKYRGQLTPKANRGDVEVHIKTVEKADGAVTVTADGYLYVDSLRVYHATGLRIRIAPAAAHLLTAPAPAPALPRPAQSAADVTTVSAADAAAVREALLETEQPLVVEGPGVGAVQVHPVPLGSLGLGSAAFMQHYGVQYPLYTGAMAKGIASADLVIAAGQRGMLASFGAGGLPIGKVTAGLDKIQAALGSKPFAVNLIHSPFDDLLEERNVDLFLSRGVTVVEASAFMKLTPHVVRYRVVGLSRDAATGRTVCKNSIIFKVSRTELADMALRPPPADMVARLLREGKVTAEQAALAATVPMCDDVTVEADSGGHTDNRPLQVLLPVIIARRDAVKLETGVHVRVGAGGGIGCPEAAAAAFAMGADFVVTGTINQLARQSGTCDTVREQLSKATYSDVVMAPAADMFESGVKLQVLKKGTMFPSRALKLYELFLAYPSLDAIPADVRQRLEKTVFRKPIDTVWQETVDFTLNQLKDPEKIKRAEADPKGKMALIFRWYLGLSSGWANAGVTDRAMDFQVWCGPAIGSFNDFVRGTYLDPAVANAYHDVHEANMQLLRGACVLRRIEQLKAHAGVRAAVDAAALAPYRPEPVA